MGPEMANSSWEPTEEELAEINDLHQQELAEERFMAIHGHLPGGDLDLVSLFRRL